jgi:endonuclease YncB( thermonuclease family)
MAKKHLTSVISGKVVKLKVVGYDKYGRVLADVSYNSLNISEHMIDVGLAVEYDGKKKQEVDWMKLLLSKTESSKELGHLTIV